MKKQLLLFCIPVLFALLPLSHAAAQADEKLVDLGGYGTSETLFEGSIFTKAPFNYVYKYTCTQQIYPAMELTEAEDMEITSMKLRYLPNDWNVWDYTYTAKIYFKEVDYSEYTRNGDEKYVWETVSEADLVYSGEEILDFQSATSAGEDIEMEFVFDTPYEYRGGNLLVMAVMYGPDPVDYTFSDFYAYPEGNLTGMPYTTLYYCDDSSTLDFPYPTLTDGAIKMRAVMQLTCVESDGPGPEPEPDDAYPIPLFKGLADEYPVGSSSVELKLMGQNSDRLTVISVNGEQASEFDPKAAGLYKVEAASHDGNHKVTKYVKVN